MRVHVGMLISNVERQFSLPLWNKKKHFIILFLNLKLGKFYVETFCTHNVVFVQQEEQDHAIVS